MDTHLRTEPRHGEATAFTAAAPAAAPPLTFRALADALPEIVWITRPGDAAPQYLNRRWHEYTGLPAETSAARGWAAALHPDDAGPFLDAWRMATATGSPLEAECRLRRGADGAYRWHLARAVPLDPDADPAADGFWTGTFTDIDRQKRAEDELRSAEEWRRRFLHDVLRAVTEDRLRLCHGPADLPARLCPAPETLPVSGVGQLGRVRASVLARCVSLGYDEGRGRDLVTAVSEAAMNALVHAGGGTVGVCGSPAAGPRGGTVQVWIEDRGRGIALDSLHRATLEKGFTTAGSMGYGFYMMLQTCDRIYLLTGPQGTTVVLEQDALPADDEEEILSGRPISLPDLTELAGIA
jgi:anti-sigma regulatory factor (Ser/Thr protein kinase)